MAVLGGMLASAVLKVVTQQIGSAIGGQIKLQKNFNDDLQKMKDTLESIEAVLEEAERRSIKEKPVQLWLNRLKNAVCDISDMIDEFEADTQPPARKLAARISCLTVVPKTCMAYKMKKMREKLEKITKQHKDFSFTEGSSSNVQQAIGIRETSSNLEEALIIGRTEDKQKIMASLSGSITQEITILPIYGIGGIGKTTLAKLVFNDTQFKDYSRAWVYVSRTFDLNKISNSIVSQVSEEQSQMTEKEMIQKRLGKVLAGKKIFIVLDDLWEKDPSKLDELRSMLKVGEGGKVVVIITTREEEIAKKNRTVEPYKIEPLTDDMCWTIIKHKSAFDSRPDQEQLELIGREIAKKCGGVALAAQSIGYILQPMRSDEWESVKNNDIWNVLASGDESSTHHVPSSLKLSYSSMSQYLKLCFAYCAIFPKGHNIGKDDLIHQWISLGFIVPLEPFSTKQLGEKYVSHLLGMSFLQHAKSQLSDGMLCEDVFTMHDLVHDLARSVMADEVLHARKTDNIGGSSCRYALLTDCSKPLNLSVTSPAKIRALCFLDCREIELDDAAISSAKHVRVLDLSGCKIRKLPHSIALLKQLRYLNAPRIHDEPFPECITKLSKLNYLNLRESYGISTLPESIGEMEGLMHLDLSGCQRIKKLPKSFVKLTDIVHLDLSHCYRVQGVVEALGGLTKLQYLNLSLKYREIYTGVVPHLRGLPEVIVSLTKLRYLNLSRCMDSSTQGYHSFIDRISTLSNLEHLDLSHNSYRGSIPESIGNLSNLEHLDLSKNDDLVSIPESIGSLKKLCTLDLSGCRRLEMLPESIGSLKKLRTLDLSGCVELERLPKSMARMDSLKAINVKYCYRLDKSTLSRSNRFALLPHFVVHAGDGESRSNLVLLQDANSDELKISRLENVKSAQEAQSIKLMGKQRIKKLEFAWTRDVERSVNDMEMLGELVPPSTLGRFRIQGYNSVSFPAWLMDIRHSLPNLDQIKMEDLPNCKCLPPLGQLPNLRKLLLEDMHGITKIDEGFYGGVRAFPQLQEFILRGMKSLEEWNTTYSSGEEGSNELMFPKLQTLRIIDLPTCKCLPPLGQIPNLQRLFLADMHGITKFDEGFYGGEGAFPQLEEFELHGMKSLEEWNTTYSNCEEGSNELMFPNLRRLGINNCPMLRMKPHPPRAMRHWSIERSDNMISSWGETVSHTRASSSAIVINLEVRCCEKPLHRWRLLHHLPTLRGLTISNCSDLTGSPEIIRHLSSLKSLYLSDEDQAELPKWLGELTSLERLYIRNYPELKDNMRQLTSLEVLELSQCGSMTSLPPWLGELTSLQKLYIRKCTGIKSLPDNIQQLTSLKELRLSQCGSMTSLPPWLGELTSLQSLYIQDCTGIKSLPDSIQQLNNLQNLRIFGCPELKQWCESEENKKKLAHINQKCWGVAMLVGVAGKDAAFKAHPMNFLNEGTLKGTFFGNYKPRTDLPGAVKMYMNKELDLDLEKFITHSVPFPEINTAFDLMLKGEILRCIIRMQD